MQKGFMTSEAAWIRGIKEVGDRGTVQFIVMSQQSVSHKKLKFSILKNHQFCSFYFWDSDRMDLFTEPLLPFRQTSFPI